MSSTHHGPAPAYRRPGLWNSEPMPLAINGQPRGLPKRFRVLEKALRPRSPEPWMAAEFRPKSQRSGWEPASAAVAEYDRWMARVLTAPWPLGLRAGSTTLWILATARFFPVAFAGREHPSPSSIRFRTWAQIDSKCARRIQQEGWLRRPLQPRAMDSFVRS